MNPKNVRIKDIARLAGVSVGTVDRVLHNRGRVSEESLKKVLKVLNEIDYQPNLIARTLGANKTYRIAALIPNPELDPYWASSESGIRMAETEWMRYGIKVEPHFFDLYNKSSFQDVAEAVSASKPDGILVAPIFYHETLPFFRLFDESKIPYILFNTNIPNVNALSFIGQDLYQSGRVGAELMHLTQHGKTGIVAILHIWEDLDNSIHLAEKERGFREYFQQTGCDFEVRTLNLHSPTHEDFRRRLDDLLNEPSLRGIFVTTSKTTAFVASSLEQHTARHISLIGYDILEENIRYMKKGIINFLINQNPQRQAFLGITHLVRNLVLKKEIPRYNLLPLEIISKENLDSYLNQQ